MTDKLLLYFVIKHKQIIKKSNIKSIKVEMNNRNKNVKITNYIMVRSSHKYKSFWSYTNWANAYFLCVSNQSSCDETNAFDLAKTLLHVSLFCASFCLFLFPFFFHLVQCVQFSLFYFRFCQSAVKLVFSSSCRAHNVPYKLHSFIVIMVVVVVYTI